MNKIVPENYSLLNCHIHANKSNLLKGCDFLSAPIRSVFGGRNINYSLNGECQGGSSILTRVMIVFASAVIYYAYSPLLLIPMAAFSLKYAVSLFDKTEINIKALIQSVISTANNKTAKARDYETAVDILSKLGRSFLRPEDDFHEALALYEIKANKTHRLSNIIENIENPSKIPGLVNYAIDHRLKHDESTGSYTLSRTELIDFVKASCFNREIKHVVNSYITLLESALLLKDSDTTRLCYKMYLIDAVFIELKKIREAIPTVEMDKENKRQIMSRIYFVLTKSEYISERVDSGKLTVIFTDEEKLNTICTTIDKLVEKSIDQGSATYKLLELFQ